MSPTRAVHAVDTSGADVAPSVLAGCGTGGRCADRSSPGPAGLRQHLPALVLNADYQSLSYFPLSLWHWQDSVRAVILGRVRIVAEYDQWVSSPSMRMRVPSVVVLREYVKPRRQAPFTRFNLFLRDSFQCQYCGATGELTFDHVVPRAAGGTTVWENVVAACVRCNMRKGARSLHGAGLALKRKPHRPSPQELRSIGRRFPPNHLHETWIDYLYWDNELER